MVETQESYKLCKEAAEKHYENFPVGSFLVPKEKTKYVHAIYAFARYADDIADSSTLKEENKVTELTALQNSIKMREELYFFSAALFDTLDNTGIPENELYKLISAFLQDSVKQRYEKFDELLDYADRSANPIGHIVLYIFGYTEVNDKPVFELSDKICTGLQLTNFWQDVLQDLEMGRIYIPSDVMDKYGYSYEKLHMKNQNEDFVKVMKELVDKTEQILYTGKPILKLVRGRLKIELAATYLGGYAILHKIEKMNYNVLSLRPKLTKQDKAGIIVKALTGVY